MSGQHYVTLSRRGPVATVTLDRPEVHNAFNEEVIAQLKSRFDELSNDEATRIVVIRSEGRSFSAGADLDWMRRMADASGEENRQDALALAAMLRTIAECSRPVVARVQGAAFGGGAGLVAASDVGIAAESAMFGFTEVRLGLVPATIAPHVVEKIGPGRALSLFLTGERFDAKRALEIGLVHQVAPDAEFDSTVDGVVEMLLQGGPSAQSACKQLVRHVASAERASVDGYTAALIASIRSGDEGREGVGAFLDKRKPGWVASDG